MAAVDRRDVCQCADVLGEAAPAPAEARVQEGSPNPLVQPHAVGHHANVRPGALADQGHLVDKADLRGQERIRGVLNHLGAPQVGDEDGAAEWPIEDGGVLRGRAAVCTEHYPVGVQEVGDRRAFAQELRIGHHVEGHLVRQLAGQNMIHAITGPNRHGALGDDGGRMPQDLADAGGCLPHVTEVRFTRRAGRGVDGNKDKLAVAQRVGVGRGKREPTGAGVASDQLLKTWLVERQHTTVQIGDLRGVYVEAHHLIAKLGKACAGHQANVAGANNRNAVHPRTTSLGD